MKDSGNSFHARHLKRALDYVMNPEKTQRGRLVGAINCQTDMAFEQMMDTKKQFGKTDKRQGYHIILSFKEDEVEPDRAFEITQKFVAEYLGDAYEAVFVVHDNTDHVHSHIVFNSVSFVDWEKSPVRFHLILFERKNDMIPLSLVCFSKLLLCIHHLLKSHICLAVYGSHKSSSLSFLRIHHIIQCPL